jgi:hypothetical protein
MRLAKRQLLAIILLALIFTPVFPVDNEPINTQSSGDNNVREGLENKQNIPGLSEVQKLAEEVDVLLIVNQLELTGDQLKFVAQKASEIRKRQEDTRKKEEEILLGIKAELQTMRDILISGKEAPSSLQTKLSTKLKDLQNLRQQAVEEFHSAVNACIRQLSEGQIRKIARTPDVQRRASELVQKIRAASEDEWPKVREEITDELLDVKKIDKQQEWETELDNIRKTAGTEKQKALEDFEKRKTETIAQMRTEIEQMLTSIREADPRILSIGINKLASALRSQVDIRNQLFAAFARILDSPCGEQALKSKLGATSSTDTATKSE